jgi:hypothetical protein
MPAKADIAAPADPTRDGADPNRPPVRRISAGRSLAAGVWLAVALLAINSFLAWRQLDEQAGPVPARGGVAEASPPAALPKAPALPAPRRTSANAIFSELDSTTRRLSDPLAVVQGQLGQAVRQLSSTRRLPPLLAGIAANTHGFGAVPGNIGRLTAEVKRLGRVRLSLRQMLARLNSLTATNAKLDDMNASIRTIRGDFEQALASVERLGGTANDTLPQVVSTLRGMASDVARMRECVEKAFVCQGGGRSRPQLPVQPSDQQP